MYNRTAICSSYAYGCGFPLDRSSGLFGIVTISSSGSCRLWYISQTHTAYLATECYSTIPNAIDTTREDNASLE